MSRTPRPAHSQPPASRRAEERDACGIGFVADGRGRGSRSIVETGLEALCRMRHRGALAADALTGDGAGVLLPIPEALLDPTGIAGGRLGVAMTFSAPESAAASRRVVAEACAEEGIEILRWRPVPVDPGALGDGARASMPEIEQALLLRPLGTDVQEAEKKAFRARRRAERARALDGTGPYVPSLSFTTVTYKALCAADQLASFYPDLADDRFVGWFTMFHQRYSTNTAPTWERAQPFRFLAHNGEVNTIRGNVAQMQARAGSLGAGDLAPEELLVPVVDEAGSDSQVMDQALELLVRGGRSLVHAAAMLVPPAWDDADPEMRDFFSFHACLSEPWDGPAGLVFSDGTRVAAALDRNGLRPLRIAVCEDGLVACATEAGAVSTQGHGRVTRRRLGPGEVFLVDPTEGEPLFDAAIKRRLGRRRPYGDWLAEHLEERSPGTPVEAPAVDPTARQVAAGYAKEEVTVILRPMATDGHEPTSSMGDDTAPAALATYGRSVFGYLKQRFAQVTNPPIDHLRERHVMSLRTRLGPREELLQERAAAARLREYPSFFLWPDEVGRLERDGGAPLDATFAVTEGEEGLGAACLRLAEEAVEAARAGRPWLIVTDREVGPERVSVPAALAAGAVHHGLLAAGLRRSTSIVVDADEPRESHHFACLLTNGADSVCPRLALESIADLARRARLGGGVTGVEGQSSFASCVEVGLLKIMSKMGISTLDSYRGAQVIEAVGLAPEVIDLCFTGVASPLGGAGFAALAREALARHRGAFGSAGKPQLPAPGTIKFRKGGEYHALNPDVVSALQEAASTEAEMASAHALRRAVAGDDAAYERFAALVNGRPPVAPRDLLEPAPLGPPVPLQEVEPAAAITRRFSTGAMSHGALSAEAHETLALAMEIVGGLANSGEGGEAPERFGTTKSCGIKQVASGRFGVTPLYLAHAKELQIKMAQGSKPGEGGELPGKKVTAEIARLRHTVPGTTLISPPPHHDIYSIEDLAQLVFDLKQSASDREVSVKLVSSEGVGTIAAGVAKGLADVIHLAGGDGGTGASLLSSIKNAGLPWEIGLADTQATLVASRLRGRVRVRVDGGMKTGRDVLMAALLGGDEFSFGTAALVAEGCILVRTCHRNTCPVGIATQNPELRAKFIGTPEMVARYLVLVAEEVRGLLAALGMRSLSEAVGRTDLLRRRPLDDPRAASLDLMLLTPDVRPDEAAAFTGREELQNPRSRLGDRLFEEALPALRRGASIDLLYPITTEDRSVGVRLGCAIAAEWDGARPPGLVTAHFQGEAGQSFGAFLSDGAELILTGEANDYVCKGLGGGRVVIKPPANDAGEPVLAGNTVLYGATGGQLFIAGRVGERFAVRNSGAVAVVEGTGDHACEYMTAGAVVVLGPVGKNMGAGMSGGEAYVYDPQDRLEEALNPQLVASYEPTAGQLESLRSVVTLHLESTGSRAAEEILATWDASHSSFRRVAPVAEVARLEALFEGTVSSPAI